MARKIIYRVSAVSLVLFMLTSMLGQVDMVRRFQQYADWFTVLCTMLMLILTLLSLPVGWLLWHDGDREGE
ncbi:hypothetical protein ACFQ1H_02390 [Scardovia wiggsiae]|uniref:hypothetical protein n=1 Tax=Scardovia wiggsiae TaxID=230143 RepID=UPI00364095B5